MKAILEFSGYTKFVEVEKNKPIYIDKFVMADQKLTLPFIKIAEKEVDGDMIAIYRLIDGKDFG